MNDRTSYVKQASWCEPNAYMSFNCGSDVAKMEEMCKPCEKQNEKHHASSYCKNCKQWLCYTCFTVHLLPVAQRNHQLVDLREFPEEYKDLTDQLEVLRHSSTEILTQFKKAHEKASNCNNETIKSFKHFRKKINDSLEKLEAEFVKQVKAKDEENARKLQEVFLKCEPVRKEAEQHLSKLRALNTTKQKFQLPEIFEQVKPRMSLLQTAVNDVVSDDGIKRCKFQPSMHTMESVKNTDFFGNLLLESELLHIPVINRQSVRDSGSGYAYVDLNKLNELTKNSEKPPLPERNNLGSPASLRNNTSFKTRKDERSDTVQTAMSPYEEQNGSVGHYRSNQSLNSDRVRYLSDIIVKTKEDKSVGCISGSTILDTESLVVTDYSNRKVKLINTQLCTVDTCFRMTKGPWDVTYVRDCLVAVTVPGEKKVFLLNCRRDLSGNRAIVKDGSISVKGHCRGIVYNSKSNCLIVTFTQYKQLGGPTKIEIIDFNGNTIQTIGMGKTADPMFINPVYVMTSKDQSKIYISDWSKESVCCLRPDGYKTHMYMDSQLKEPYKIAPGPDDSIYVCGIKSHNIHKISLSMKKIGITVSENDGVKAPISVTFCEGTNKLFVGMQESDCLKVFQVE